MYKFSPYIGENLKFLQKLAKTRSDPKKKALILKASSDQILAIVEICINILKSKFTLTPLQRKKLALYAEYYRKIARTRTEKSARKRIQEGSGVALGAVLVPVLSVIAQHLLEKVLP